MDKQGNTKNLIPSLMAVDFTEEKLSILLTSMELKVIYQGEWQLPKLESENEWSWEIGGRIATSFIQDKKPYYALAIAVGCPGIIDNSNGVILDSRGNNTFKDFHITDAIRRHIDTPIAVLDRVQAMFHRVTGLNKNQDNNDALFIYFEDGFCISTIKVGGLYFPGDYFQFGKNSSKHAITLDQEQLSKKIFEIANSLDLKKIYMHSKETSNLIDEIITTLSGWDRKIDVTRPVVNEDTTLKGLIDIASSIAYENQTVIFR
ncbi:MAG: hypothetical protein CL752_01275 [Chloroflexi bacterium]|nr:hypothetical protein [Chloroflexota bacterium]